MKTVPKPINEQAAVIFGASSGIGRIAALDFAKRGAKRKSFEVPIAAWLPA